MSKDQFKEIQEILGYTFKDTEWLKRALTHSSSGEERNYQRLEFLGDRVLGLVIAHALFTEFSDENEGGLAKRYTALVQGKTLAIIAQEQNIGDHIIFSEAEKNAGGNLNENILSDVVESLLGAIHVDGGYEEARKVILSLYGDKIHTLREAPQDPKTELQEWVQARGLGLPQYNIVDRTGPDHAPEFHVQLDIEGEKSLIALGQSRRQAEKIAATDMLKLLKGSN